MRAHASNLTHLSDAVLLRDLRTLVARDRETTAALLAHIAEVDERRLYVPAGYSSMHAYCVEELRFSEGAALRRIRAARAARQFPGLFAALADGSVHLTAVLMLAPHLTSANLNELLAAATRLRKPELEVFLAQRCGRTESPAAILRQLAPARVEFPGTVPLAPVDGALASVGPGPVDGAPASLAPARVEHPETGPLAASAPRVLLQLAIDEDVQKKLRYAQALLSHAVPSGDIAKVFDRALDALIAQAEKQKFGATSRPRPRPRTQAAPARTRSISAEVRRAVWERDGGQCTFAGENGHRCGARRFLEFDHVEPVARGGRPTEDGIRLRLPGAQSIRSRAHLRSSIHGGQAAGCTRAHDRRRSHRFARPTND